MTSNSFADIAARLQAALIAEIQQSRRTPPIVAVWSFDVLKRYWDTYPEAGVTFSPFGKSGNAVVQNGPHGAVLWMNPLPDSYRGTFGRFLKTYWGATSDLSNSGYDVDHLYNRERAKQYGYNLVRMFLVASDINRLHGTVYEGPLGRAERDREPKSMKLLDAMSELKVLGFPPVKDRLLTPAHYDAARLASKIYDISFDAAVRALQNLYDRSQGRR